jgi:P pilus assembly chaperone PapD
LAIRLSYSTQRATAHYMEGAIMALRRQKNNIVNLALVIANEDEKAGMTIDQTILNGKSAAVSFRLVNGGRKSAAVKLDRQACADLLEAVTEILASEGDF